MSTLINYSQLLYYVIDRSPKCPILLFNCMYVCTGGNGTGTGNETEDEDHEFFDAVEEGVPTNMDDKTSFVIKVPVSPLLNT